MDPQAQVAVMKLIICWMLVGVFIFTAIATCLSLIGIVKFVDSKQQSRLFVVLIVEVVIVCVSVFRGILEFNPKKTVEKIEEPLKRANASLVTTLQQKDQQLAAIQVDLGRQEYANGKSLYEQSETKPWSERTEQFQIALEHFKKSNDLYKNSLSSLFIAVIDAKIPEREEAKLYAEQALNESPPLNAADTNTANQIIAWATRNDRGAKPVLGGGTPLEAVNAPTGELQ